MISILQYAIGKVLEVIVEPGSKRVFALLDHRVDQIVQLFVGAVHMEAISQRSYRSRASSEARQLRTWNSRYIF